MPANDELQQEFEAEAIASMVREGTTLIEVGCWEGELLELLITKKNCRGYGIEENHEGIYKCVEKGLSVMHDALETGLKDYPDKAFDYVVLDKSFARVIVPDNLIRESLRVGKQVIVSFSNFGHWHVRTQVLFGGKTPITESLPYQWYNTPNIHFVSVLDFLDYCEKNKLKVEKKVFVSGPKQVTLLPNLFAQSAIFLISLP